jgi:hypothetical protein
MARVHGPGIDPGGVYEAVELVGRGMYRLERKIAPEPDLDGLMTIKISREAARRIGRHKFPGETLAQAVERLALASLPGKTAAG